MLTLRDGRSARSGCMALAATPILLLLAWAWSSTGIASGSSPGGPPASAVRADTVRALISAAHYDEAQALAQSRLDGLMRAQGIDSLEVAEAIDLLVEAVWRTEKSTPPWAVGLARRAVAIRERDPAVASLGLAGSLTGLGRVLRRVGALEEARAAYERALAIRGGLLGAEHPQVAISLTSLGLLAKDRGDLEGARLLLARALDVRKKALGPSSKEVAAALNNLSGVMEMMGQYGRERVLMERAIAAFETPPLDTMRLAFALNSYAGCLGHLLDFATMRGASERAVSLMERLQSPDHILLRGLYENLAISYEGLREFDRSLEMYGRALAIADREFGRDNPESARILISQGRAAREAGRWKAALALLARADSILKGRNADLHRQIAEAKEAGGDIAGARAHFERAHALREGERAPEHPDLAEDLWHVASSRLTTGDTSGVLWLALRSEMIYREHLRLVAEAMTEGEAMQYATSRPPALDLLVSLASGSLDVEKAHAAWDAIVRSRALILDVMAARNRMISAPQDTATARLAGERAAASRRLAALMFRGPEPYTRDEYVRLVREAQSNRTRIERAIATRSEAFRTQEARRRIGLREVFSTLPAGSALIGYIRYQRSPVPWSDVKSRAPGGPSFSAFLVRAGERSPVAIHLGGGEEIDSLVSRWRRLTRPSLSGSGETEYRNVGRALRERVWDPIASRLAGVKRVFVVPDGSLNLVNLHALPVGRSRFLVESGPTISYLSSERDLVPLSAPESGSGGLLALGGVDFDRSSPLALSRPRGRRPSSHGSEALASSSYRGPTSSCESFRSLQFEDLPATRRETEELLGLCEGGARGWKSTSSIENTSDPERQAAIALTGANASEEAFKHLAPGRGLLHLATHAFFLGDVSTGRNDRAGLSDCGGARENPLLASGLALAGANQRRHVPPGSEDGILTAEEIAALDLSRVDAVVLSACETGLGSIVAGEGVFGLRRAFEVAGARSLVMSLWKVDDLAARQWMRAFYEACFFQHRTTAEAARLASELMLREQRARGERPSPYSWGAFITQGG